MEWLLLGGALLAMFLIASNMAISKAKQVQVENSDTLLDGWFDGSPQVSVEQGPTTLDADTIVAGASTRGYRLVSSTAKPYPKQQYRDMLFEKA